MTGLFLFLAAYYVVANRGWLRSVYRNRVQVIKSVRIWARTMAGYDNVFWSLCAVCLALAVWGVSWFMP
jgi:hypothetical protein